MIFVSLVLFVSLIIGVSFFCSLTEAVLLSLNPLQLRVGQSKGEAQAGKWLALKQRIERPIAAILVFNTIANTGLATLAGAVFVQCFGAEWLWSFSLVLTIAILFGAEMAPKIIGVHHAPRFAAPLLGPLEWMIWIGRPLVSLMEGFCERLKSRNPGNVDASDHIMDIITLVQSAKAERVLHNREEIIIIHAATLSARRVKSAMVPAAAAKVFDLRKSLLENVQNVGPKLHRSYPVSADGTLDSVHGYVRMRELLLENLTSNGGSDWLSQVRPVLRMDGNASLTQLLAAFLESKEIAALVHSGQTSNIGWITLDDVTETLMGAR